MGWASPDPHKKGDMYLILTHLDIMYGDKLFL